MDVRAAVRCYEVMLMGYHERSLHALGESFCRWSKQHAPHCVHSSLRQDANTLVPNVTDTLCLAAKAWSDVCYLDEISGRARESLSAQDKQAVNTKAMQYAQQVLAA